MSDWRSGTNKDGNGRKETRPKSIPVKPATPKANPSSTATSGSSPDWRGNSKKRVVENKPQDKSWTGRGREKTTSTSALTKAFLLGGLGLVIASLFYVFWVFVFLRDPKLPIVVSIASDYSSLDLGTNSFGVQDFKLRPEKLHLFPANEPSANGESFKLDSNEKFLDEIRTNEKWGQSWKEIEIYSKGTSLVGGGPSRSVTAYFISSLIAREKAPGVNPGIADNSSESTDSTPWMLLTKGDDPFGRSIENPLNIKTLLERIAKQTAKDKYAFVIMDVKPPTVVANLGDSEFPKKAFQGAFDGVSPELKDRLIVCLPCDEGEENWIAPEFRSSVFAHFFWKGVTTGLDNSKKKWSMLEFQKSLREKVTNWVARHRYAKQTPTFLMSRTTEDRIKDVLFVETSGGEFELPSRDNLKSDLEKRYASLEGLWDDYDKLKHCLVTDPLRYTTVESGLIQMEDLAEYGSDSAWNKFEARIKEHFKKLQEGAKFDRRVSLVEAEKNYSVFKDSSVFSEQADANCLKAWNGLLRAAETNKKQDWAKAFSETEIGRAVKECALSPERAPVEWIEVRLLKLIHEAIRDIAETPKAQEAIAGLIKTYSDLNKIAFEPRTELSKWTQAKILKMDKLFAECFDHFYANDFDASLEKLENIRKEFPTLSKEFESLKAAMEVRDEVLWLTPHLLASQMRMSRQSDAKDDKSASDIASLLKDAIGIRDALVDDQASPATLSLKPEAAKKLEDLKNKQLKAFTEVDKRAAADAGTLQMTRTALRWPLLTKELRKSLHRRLTTLYETKKEESDGSGDTKREWSSLTPRSVGEVFLSELTSQDNNLEKVRTLYEPMVKNDARYSIRMIPVIDTDKDKDERLAQVKQRVYFESYQTRMVASSFGQRAMAKLPTALQWPWDAPDQLHAINKVLYNDVQCERLCVSRWGDGDLNGPNEKLYFERMLAEGGSFSKSFNASPQLALQYTQSKSISANLEAERKKFLDNAIAEVKQLGVTASPFELSEETRVSFTVKPNDWDAFATLSIHGESGPPERVRFLKSGKANSEGLPLSKAAGQAESIKTLNLDPKPDGKNQLRLGVRGHYTESPLKPADPVKSFQIDSQRPISPATVRVGAKDNQAITMWVLLDCSASMAWNDIYVKSEDTARKLLQQVMDLNEKEESPIHVGFIVFGRHPEAKNPEILEQCEIGNQIFKSAIMEKEKIGQLIDLVASDWIRPSGCTPLYDAIFTACEESKNDDRNWIVVISDGSNYVDLLPSGNKYDSKYYYPKNGNKQVAEIRQKVLKTKSKLFVYQYSNDAYYKEAMKDGKKQFGDSDIEKINIANEELRTLLNDVSPQNAGSSKSKLFYSSFEDLSKDLNALLPVSTVTITDSNGIRLGDEPFADHKFGREIKLNVSEPTQATITVNSRDKKSNPLPFSLTGGEKLEFNYTDSRGLTMIPFKNKSNGFTGSSKPMEVDGNSKFKVAVKATRDVAGLKRLEIQLALQGVGAETVDQATFTRRPRFFVASIRPAGDPRNQAFWVCDHSFRPNTHYPIVKLPDIPWHEDKQWRSKEVDIEVWMSDEAPKNAVKISLLPGDQPPGDQKDVNEPKLRCVRTKDQVTVTVPESMDRPLVMCSSATKTTRDYVDGRETKIVFEVPSSQAAEIYIVKESELKAWSKDGTVQHYSVSELKF